MEVILVMQEQFQVPFTLTLPGEAAMDGGHTGNAGAITSASSILLEY